MCTYKDKKKGRRHLNIVKIGKLPGRGWCWCRQCRCPCSGRSWRSRWSAAAAPGPRPRVDPAPARGRDRRGQRGPAPSSHLALLKLREMKRNIFIIDTYQSLHCIVSLTATGRFDLMFKFPLFSLTQCPISRRDRTEEVAAESGWCRCPLSRHSSTSPRQQSIITPPQLFLWTNLCPLPKVKLLTPLFHAC